MILRETVKIFIFAGLVMFPEGKKKRSRVVFFQDRALEATKRLQISDVSKVHLSRPASPARVPDSTQCIRVQYYFNISAGIHDIDQRLCDSKRPKSLSDWANYNYNGIDKVTKL